MKNYPFCAVVGQDHVKTALTLLAIDPRIGGLVLSGARGSAKSTLARSLAELLPNPEGRFITMPLAASEEMVTGTLDLQKVLNEQQVAFQPGLLHSAHEGVLYVDEVNLLADNLVDLLLDVTASGINTVERDGISQQHAARFVLVGTMNPDEGELRAQFKDRFGLSVELTNQYSAQERIEIVRRREAFDADAEKFCQYYQQEQEGLAEQIKQASLLLEQVTCDDSLRLTIAERCVAANVDGLRADIVWLRAAKSHAAWRLSKQIELQDIDAVEAFVLAHRQNPVTPNSPPPTPPQDSPYQRPDQDNQDEQAGFDTGSDQGSGDWGSMPPIQQSVAETSYLDVPLLSNPILHGVRKGKIASNNLSTKPDWFSTLATNLGQWPLTRLRFHRDKKASDIVHLVMLDTSASTIGDQLLSQAKGLIAGIAEQAYLARQQMAVVGFGNQEVKTLLAKRRAPKQITALLNEITAGGGTPLRDALLYVQDYCRQLLKANPATQFICYLITDGRTNQKVDDITLPGECLLIDMESSAVKRGRGAALAQSLQARYMTFANLSTT